MPIDTSIDQDLNAVVHIVRGDATYAEMKVAYQHGITHPDFKVNMNALWDVSQGSVGDVTRIQFEEMIDLIKLSMKQRGISIKVVLLIEKAVDFGMGRMFETMCAAKGVAHHVRVFRNREDAVAWIGAKEP